MYNILSYIFIILIFSGKYFSVGKLIIESDINFSFYLFSVYIMVIFLKKVLKIGTQKIPEI